MSVKELIAEINEKHSGKPDAEEAVELCNDGCFSDAAQYLCRLNDKDIARKLYKLDLELKNDDPWELSCLAGDIADEEFLGDKEWAKEILADAVTKSDNFQQFQLIARTMSDSYQVNDKASGKEAFARCAESAVSSNDYKELAEGVLDERYLDDKDLARTYLKTAVDKAECAADFLFAATSIGSILGDKSWAIEVCNQGLECGDDADDIERIKDLIKEYN